MAKKTRLRTDFNIIRTLRMHKDGVVALDSLAKQFRGAYVKNQLTTFAVLLLTKQIKEKGVKPGDNIEEIFKI